VKLNVAENQLEDLPDSLVELESLRELDVSQNMIKVQEKQIFCLF
jgi:Leucine-rich repeat (LRR) protein